jgi:hypothetical protein
MVVSYHYMPMDLIGWLVMTPPILQLGIDFIILWVPPFLSKNPFLGDPWEKHMKVFFFGFYLFLANFTLWVFSSFFPQGKVQPFASLANPVLEPMLGMDEREDDGK